MNFSDPYQLEIESFELSEKIENTFERYKVYMCVTYFFYKPDRVVMQIKLKKDTRESRLLARVHDVQLRLKLPVFYVINRDFTIFLVVSDQKIVYDHLPKIINTSTFMKKSKNMLLPYVIGHDPMGELIVDDVCKFQHLLIAGSTNSGKTVGLQSLIVSITYNRSPIDVNVVMIDVGAAGLVIFENIPHLSCPVIRNRNAAYQALILLKAELERRIALQISDEVQFKKLPRIMLVIDEFPALFAGIEDRQISRAMAEAVSCLLQRGRHAKMHVILAAQNPTIQNMKVDLGNITARAAFTCAKRNFSEVILGESGAENLSGQGDMYFKAPQFNGLQRIQGVFISPEELEKMSFGIRSRWVSSGYISQMKFTIAEKDLQHAQFKMIGCVNTSSLTMEKEVSDRLFAEVMLWVLGKKSISCNTIMKTFGLGWNRASRFIEQLNYFGIVDDLDAKLPRMVLPRSLDDIPTEVMELLESNGFSTKIIAEAISDRI